MNHRPALRVRTNVMAAYAYLVGDQRQHGFAAAWRVYHTGLHHRTQTRLSSAWLR
jgi:hypothetical protein